MKRKSLLLLGALGLALIAGAAAGGGALAGRSDVATVDLGPHSFAVPWEHLYQSGFLDRLLALPGLDDSSRDVLLYFEAEELAAAVPGYQARDADFETNILVRLVAQTLDERVYLNDVLYRDLWYGEGSYESRIVEPDPDHPWFRVFRAVDYPYSWVLLSQPPDANRPLPDSISDYLIAHCLERNAPATSSGRNVNCQTRVLVDDLKFEFSLTNHNLHLIDSVKAYLESQIMSWRAD